VARHTHVADDRVAAWHEGVLHHRVDRRPRPGGHHDPFLAVVLARAHLKDDTVVVPRLQREPRVAQVLAGLDDRSQADRLPDLHVLYPLATLVLEPGVGHACQEIRPDRDFAAAIGDGTLLGEVHPQVLAPRLL